MAFGNAFSRRQQKGYVRPSAIPYAGLVVQVRVVHVPPYKRRHGAEKPFSDRRRKQGCRSRRNIYWRQEKESRICERGAEKANRNDACGARRPEPFVPYCGRICKDASRKDRHDG